MSDKLVLHVCNDHALPTEEEKVKQNILNSIFIQSIVNNVNKGKLHYEK